MVVVEVGGSRPASRSTSDHALRRCDVREVHDAGDVADRVDALGRRHQARRPSSPSRGRARRRAASSAEAVDVRLEADADQHLVGVQSCSLPPAVKRDGRAAVRAGRARSPARAGDELDALLLERALELDADLLVFERQQVVEQLDDRDVDAVGAPERARTRRRSGRRRRSRRLRLLAQRERVAAVDDRRRRRSRGRAARAAARRSR